jgi:hypothetical protein
VQVKVSGDAHSSYRGRGTFRNGLLANAFDGLVREAFSAQVASRLRGCPTALDDSCGAQRLRIEARDCALHELRGDSATQQIVSDQGIAAASLCEQPGSVPGEPLIIDRPRLDKPSDGLLASNRGDISACQPLGKLLLREVATRNRARSPGQRLVPAKLTP